MSHSALKLCHLGKMAGDVISTAERCPNVYCAGTAGVGMG